MHLTFIYQPVDDLEAAVAFYRDVLGWEESWRESDDTVAFAMPDQDTEIMLTSITDSGAAGPMYLVESVDDWVAAHPEVPVANAKSEIPGGAVVGLLGPGGSTFHVFELDEG